MPIHNSAPPEDGPRILSEHLGAVLQGPAGHRHGAVESLERVHVAEPQATFHYGLDVLLAKAGLEGAEQTGWEYIVFDGERPIGMALLGLEPDGSLRFEGLTSGPTVEARLEALRFAEEHDHADSNDLELRVMSMPALYVLALWLHGKEDHFVPVHDTPPLLRKHLYTWPEIEAALQERAREVKSYEEFV